MSKILIYHGGGCSDGFCSAFLFWKVFGNEIEYAPRAYNDKVPDVKDKEVYMVDFSYDKETIEKILSECKSLVWLDHHQTSHELMLNLKHEKALIVTDQNKSGAMLAYDYLTSLGHDLTKYELLARYIEDNDLWKFELPDSKEFSTAERSYPQDFEVWNNFNVKELIEIGKPMLKFYNQKIEDIARLAYDKIIFGHNVPIVNCPGLFASDIGHVLCKGKPFSVSWSYLGKYKKFKFALRSDENGLDVAELAQKVGGGGHKHAAGFELTPEQVDSIIDLE